MDDVADDDVGKADSAPDIETPEEVTPAGELVRMICGSGTVDVRNGNGTQYSRITAAPNGEPFDWVATAGTQWRPTAAWAGCPASTAKQNPPKEQRHSRSFSLNAAFFRFESGLRTEYRYRPLSIYHRKH